MVFQPEDVDGILASNCEPLTLRVGPLTRKLIKCKNVHENRDDAEETREICETRRTDDALRGAPCLDVSPTFSGSARLDHISIGNRRHYGHSFV